MKHSLLFLLLLFTGPLAFSQDINRYIVFFSDKEGSAYTLTRPHEFLTARALARRERYNIPVVAQDLPVSEQYVQEVKELGVPVYFRSRWLNAVLVEGTTQQMEMLGLQPFVEKVTYVAPGKKLGARLLTAPQAPVDVPQTQHEFLGIPLMHELGLTGKGKMIAVLDDGFKGVSTLPKFDHLYRNNQLLFTQDFVGNSNDVYRYDDHGTKSLSTIAVVDSGTFIGTAPDALFLLAVTEDVSSEYIVEEYNWLLGSEWADSLGADVITSSLGYYTFDDPAMNHTHSELDGKTTVVAKAATWATERGILVVNSAGNARSQAWGKIGTPADADNILAVGAIDAQKNIAAFSSPGPSADGRVKPDVVALGVATVVVNASGDYVLNNGTSFSGPQIAGFAASIWQAFPSLSNLQIREIIIQSADRYEHPDNDFGYGLPNYQLVTALEEKASDEIAVYPNPLSLNQGLLQLIGVQATQKPVQVQIMDGAGRMLIQQQLTPNAAGKYEFDVKALPAGMYYLQLMYEKGHSVHKFLRM